jgi:hypothetical protein
VQKRPAIVAGLRGSCESLLRRRPLPDRHHVRVALPDFLHLAGDSPRRAVMANAYLDLRRNPPPATDDRLFPANKRWLNCGYGGDLVFKALKYK